MNDVVCKTLQNLSGDLFDAYDQASLTFELSEAVEGTFPFTVSFSDSFHWYQGRITVLGKTFVADGDLFLDFVKDVPDIDPYPMTMRLETPGKTYEGVMHLPNPWKHSTPGETPVRDPVPSLDWTVEEVNRLGPGSVYGFALWGGEMLAVGGDSYCEDEGEEGFLAWCESGTKLTHPAPRAHGLRRPWVRGDRLYLPGEHGLLAMSDDRGASWSLADLDGQDCGIFRVVQDPGGGLIAATDEGILGSDDGQTWRWLNEDVSVRAVCFTKTRAIFCGDDVVIREDNECQRPEECEHAETLFAITRMPKSGALIMVGDGGQVLRSRDEGDTWKQLQSPNDEDMEIEDCITIADGLLVVGADGLMSYTGDEGDSWHAIEHPWEDTHLRVLAKGDRNGVVWVGGDGGLVATIHTNANSDAVPY